jgi:hypothetical protein
MRYLVPAAFAALLVSASAFGQAQPTPGAGGPGGPGAAAPPVTGTVKSFDGKVLVVDAGAGGMVSAAVTPTTRYTMSVKKTVADIKPGDFIASGGTVGPDGKLRANEIRIFSAPAGEGQFPMSQPGQTMTNATVKEVMTDATVKQVGGAGSAPVIKLTFHGAGAPGTANCTGRAAQAPGGPGTGCVGETEFEVPANIPIVAQVPGDMSMLKPGTKVSARVAKAADGSSSVSQVTVSQ